MVQVSLPYSNVLDNACLIDVHFGVLFQVLVFQARLVKLDIVPVVLPILREIPKPRLKFLEMPGGTEVGEFVDYIKGAVADLDYRDLTYVLGTRIGLLEVDCEAKVFTSRRRIR